MDLSPDSLIPDPMLLTTSSAAYNNMKNFLTLEVNFVLLND